MGEALMYGWLWRVLPGPVWLRLMLALTLLAAVLVILFLWVFPALAPYIPFNDNTVE
ncbi:MAG: hypothetical protein WBG57_05490 [Ornithinimicrobium sp.]